MLGQLPTELVSLIAEFADWRTLLTLLGVSRDLRTTLVRQPQPWRVLVLAQIVPDRSRSGGRRRVSGAGVGGGDAASAGEAFPLLAAEGGLDDDDDDSSSDGGGQRAASAAYDMAVLRFLLYSGCGALPPPPTHASPGSGLGLAPWRAHVQVVDAAGTPLTDSALDLLLAFPNVRVANFAHCCALRQLRRSRAGGAPVGEVLLQRLCRRKLAAIAALNLTAAAAAATSTATGGTKAESKPDKSEAGDAVPAATAAGEPSAASKAGSALQQPPPLLPPPHQAHQQPVAPPTGPMPPLAHLSKLYLQSTNLLGAAHIHDLASVGIALGDVALCRNCGDVIPCALPCRMRGCKRLVDICAGCEDDFLNCDWSNCKSGAFLARICGECKPLLPRLPRGYRPPPPAAGEEYVPAQPFPCSGGADHHTLAHHLPAMPAAVAVPGAAQKRRASECGGGGGGASSSGSGSGGGGCGGLRPRYLVPHSAFLPASEIALAESVSVTPDRLIYFFCPRHERVLANCFSCYAKWACPGGCGVGYCWECWNWQLVREGEPCASCTEELERRQRHQKQHEEEMYLHEQQMQLERQAQEQQSRRKRARKSHHGSGDAAAELHEAATVRADALIALSYAQVQNQGHQEIHPQPRDPRNGSHEYAHDPRHAWPSDQQHQHQPLQLQQLRDAGVLSHASDWAMSVGDGAPGAPSSSSPTATPGAAVPVTVGEHAVHGNVLPPFMGGIPSEAGTYAGASGWELGHYDSRHHHHHHHQHVPHHEHLAPQQPPAHELGAAILHPPQGGAVTDPAASFPAHSAQHPPQPPR